MSDNKLAEVERALRDAVAAGIELALTRSDVDGEPPEYADFPAIAKDAVNAMQGIDCCDERPSVEWVKLTTVISRLLDAAHADALRAAAAQAKVWPQTGLEQAILALIPERARLERELEMATAVITALKEAEDKSVMWIRTRVADLEVKLAALR